VRREPDRGSPCRVGARPAVAKTGLSRRARSSSPVGALGRPIGPKAVGVHPVADRGQPTGGQAGCSTEDGSLGLADDDDACAESPGGEVNRAGGGPPRASCHRPRPDSDGRDHRPAGQRRRRPTDQVGVAVVGVDQVDYVHDEYRAARRRNARVEQAGGARSTHPSGPFGATAGRTAPRPACFDPRVPLRLAAYIRRERIDLIHTHNRYAPPDRVGLGGGAGPAGRVSRPSTIWSRPMTTGARWSAASSITSPPGDSAHASSSSARPQRAIFSRAAGLPPVG